jgi:hypothetical protein
MRWLLMICMLVGCGPNRQMTQGKTIVTAVQTVPLKYPGKKD